MAAACARSLVKVGWTVLESPALRRPGTSVHLPVNAGSRASRRFYYGGGGGGGGTGARSGLLWSLQGRGNGALGCAFLLGGGVGLYHTFKFYWAQQRQLAQEQAEVRCLIPGEIKWREDRD